MPKLPDPSGPPRTSTRDVAGFHPGRASKRGGHLRLGRAFLVPVSFRVRRLTQHVVIVLEENALEGQGDRLAVGGAGELVHDALVPSIAELALVRVERARKEDVADLDHAAGVGVAALDELGDDRAALLAVGGLEDHAHGATQGHGDDLLLAGGDLGRGVRVRDVRVRAAAAEDALEERAGGGGDARGRETSASAASGIVGERGGQPDGHARDDARR